MSRWAIIYIVPCFFATVPGCPPFPATVELYLSLS